MKSRRATEAGGSKQRVLVYVKDGPGSSSTTFRIDQYRPSMERAGAQVLVRALAPLWLWRARYNTVGPGVPRRRATSIRIMYIAVTTLRAIWFLAIDCARPPDVMIIGRSLLPKTFVQPNATLYRTALARAGRVVWDFDDDILISREISRAEFDLLERKAAAISVTHDGLRSLVDASQRAKVRLVPTTDGSFRHDDRACTMAARRASYRETPRICWVGSSSGMTDIALVVPWLDAAAGEFVRRTGRTLRFEVVCNRPLQTTCSHLDVVNIQWSQEAAHESIRRAHLGIMPLVDSPFARGKGGFKLVQYMAAGLPTVASDVGFNAEVVVDGVSGNLVDNEPEAWESAILHLMTEQDAWESFSHAALQRWTDHFNFTHAESFWLDQLSNRPSKSTRSRWLHTDQISSTKVQGP